MPKVSGQHIVGVGISGNKVVKKAPNVFQKNQIVAAPNTAPGHLGRVWIGLTEWSTLPIPGFECLADTGSFTVTGGYAKVNTVEVPLRKGLTVFAGFDPITATLPVLLDRFGEDLGEVDLNVEKACEFLEWCAGRGRPLEKVAAAAESDGSPPQVELSSNDHTGNPTRLIPFNFQWNANNSRPPRWIITGLAWGQNIRDRRGIRQRQKVTITFTESVSNPLTGEYSPVTEKNKRKSGDWTGFTVGNRRNSGGETPYEIAVLILHVPKGEEAKRVANEIKKKHEKRLHLSNINSVIKNGTVITIPRKWKLN